MTKGRKRPNPETGKPFKKGDLRDDGAEFITYTKIVKKDGTFREQWKLNYQSQDYQTEGGGSIVFFILVFIAGFIGLMVFLGFEIWIRVLVSIMGIAFVANVIHWLTRDQREWGKKNEYRSTPWSWVWGLIMILFILTMINEPFTF